MDLIGWLIFLVALLVSVMLHESGHFVTAKAFGMKVTRYFVGFGPTIASTWRGETEYGIKAIPLGGFVKIIGMHSMDDVEDPLDEPRAFRSHPAWQRIIVLCAGSFMHFLLAFLIVFGLAVGIGIETDNTTQLGVVTTCVAANMHQYDNDICTASDAESPAKKAGLRVGDTVTAFDGHPVSNWTQLDDVVRKARPGSAATITVRRDGKTLVLHTTLSSVNGRSGAYLGVAPAYVFQAAGPWHAVQFVGTVFGEEITGSASALKALPSEIPALFRKNRDQTSAGQITSVVGAAEETGQAVAETGVGWQYKVDFVLLIIAALNIFVGVFNLLPLLPMDGGHVLAIILEKIRAWFARRRGRPDPGLFDISKLLPVSFGIFAIIMFFVVVLVAADIVRPVNIVG